MRFYHLICGGKNPHVRPRCVNYITRTTKHPSFPSVSPPLFEKHPVVRFFRTTIFPTSANWSPSLCGISNPIPTLCRVFLCHLTTQFRIFCATHFFSCSTFTPPSPPHHSTPAFLSPRFTRAPPDLRSQTHSQASERERGGVDHARGGGGVPKSASPVGSFVVLVPAPWCHRPRLAAARGPDVGPLASWSRSCPAKLRTKATGHPKSDNSGT